jgi:glutamine amidotransferase
VGLEHGVTPGLGWIRGEIAPMDPRDAEGAPPAPAADGLNALHPLQPGHPLLDGIGAGEHAYFVHSYALRGGAEAELLATTDYGGPVAAVIGRGNLAGMQFHVEKSGPAGLRLLLNFLRWPVRTP